MLIDLIQHRATVGSFNCIKMLFCKHYKRPGIPLTKIINKGMNTAQQFLFSALINRIMCVLLPLIAPLYSIFSWFPSFCRLSCYTQCRQYADVMVCLSIVCNNNFIFVLRLVKYYLWQIIQFKILSKFLFHINFLIISTYLYTYMANIILLGGDIESNPRTSGYNQQKLSICHLEFK